MIPIENEKRIEWHKIRAEYIAGASQRALAEKYHVSRDAIALHCRREKWTEQREKAKTDITQNIIQKTAEAAAENAVIAERLKRKLLLRLERMEAKYPFDATEIKTHEGKNTVIFKIRDLTAAYKDLTDDLQKAANADIEDLTPLRELLK